MPIPLGIVAVAGAGGGGGAAGDYVLLQTTLISTTTSSVTFSNLGTLGAGYKHLQIRSVARSDSTGTWDLFFLRFNGVSTPTYANHKLRGTGSSVVSNEFTNDSGIALPRLPRISNGTNAYTAAVVDFLDFGVATKNKTIRLLGGGPGTDQEIALGSGFRDSTDAITSFTFSTPSGNGFAAGSRFSLYGIR
jgi:hypothetical protein